MKLRVKTRTDQVEIRMIISLESMTLQSVTQEPDQRKTNKYKAQVQNDKKIRRYVYRINLNFV